MPKFQPEKFGTKTQVGGDAIVCTLCKKEKPIELFGAKKQTSGSRRGPPRYAYPKRRCLPCQRLLDREKAYAWRMAGKPTAPNIADVCCGICCRHDCGRRLIFEHGVDPTKKSARWPRGEPYHAGWVCDKTNTRVLCADERVHNLRAYVWRDARLHTLPTGAMAAAVDAAAAAADGVLAKMAADAVAAAAAAADATAAAAEAIGGAVEAAGAANTN